MTHNFTPREHSEFPLTRIYDTNTPIVFKDGIWFQGHMYWRLRLENFMEWSIKRGRRAPDVLVVRRFGAKRFTRIDGPLAKKSVFDPLAKLYESYESKIATAGTAIDVFSKFTANQALEYDAVNGENAFREKRVQLKRNLEGLEAEQSNVSLSGIASLYVGPWAKFLSDDQHASYPSNEAMRAEEMARNFELPWDRVERKNHFTHEYAKIPDYMVSHQTKLSDNEFDMIFRDCASTCKNARLDCALELVELYGIEGLKEIRMSPDLYELALRDDADIFEQNKRVKSLWQAWKTVPFLDIGDDTNMLYIRLEHNNGLSYFYNKVIKANTHSANRYQLFRWILYHVINPPIYEAEWNSHIHVTISVVRLPTLAPPPPVMAHGDLQCVLLQIAEQSKRKSILKEEVPEFVGIEIIEQLEAKYPINVYIFSEFGELRLWRKPSVLQTIKSKKFNANIYIKCHNNHASALTFNDVKKALVCKAESKSNEIYEDDRVLICNRSTKVRPNVWLSSSEIDDMHKSLSDERHLVIYNGKKILGIIHNNTNYKDKELLEYRFIKENTRAWSLSSWALNRFRDYLDKQPEIIRAQIPNSIVYNNIKLCQTPTTFARTGAFFGKIHQIDQTRAYMNCALGNFYGADKYYVGFPLAPRSIKTFKQDLDDDLYEQLGKLGLGFAYISYDQSATAVPFPVNGSFCQTGMSVVYLPVLNYMRTLPNVKIHVIQYYYTKIDVKMNPFKAFIGDMNNVLDEQAELLDNCHNEDRAIGWGERNFKGARIIPNLLIGAINKDYWKTETFSTTCETEHIAFLCNLRDTNKEVIGYNRIVTGATTEHLYYYRKIGDRFKRAFNMTHWSKAVKDYQKIALHQQIVKLCANDFNNLLAINTDSITYIGDEMPLEDNEFWHHEARGDQFLCKSAGCRMIFQGSEVVMERHSGFLEALSPADMRKLAQEAKQIDDDNDEPGLPLARDYNIEDGDKPLAGQRLVNIFSPGGYGKSELLKYICGEESKFNAEQVSKISEDIVPYGAGNVLKVAPTHIARILIGGSHTVAGLFSATRRLSLNTSKLKAIYIDEAGMLDEDDLDDIDKALRSILINRPFGGIDVYLTGDIKQLPKPQVCRPIIYAKSFKLFNEIKLTVNHRASGKRFNEILEFLRDQYDYGGDKKSKVSAKDIIAKIHAKFGWSPTYGEAKEDTKIAMLNEVVNKINFAEPVVPGTSLTSRVNSKGVYNGQKMTVARIDDSHVYTTGGKKFPIDYLELRPGESYPRVQRSGAYTVYCAQGQTLESITIYLDRLNVNLLYVAMSRARDLDNIRFV